MKQQKHAVDVPSRRRGRPKKDDAMSGAQRARLYREKQKALGPIKRDAVTKKADPHLSQDLAFWMANSERIGELLREATAQRDFLKAEIQQLHKDNASLLARAKEAEHATTVSQKEWIVTRKKLAELRRKP